MMGGVVFQFQEEVRQIKGLRSGSAYLSCPNSEQCTDSHLGRRRLKGLARGDILVRRHVISEPETGYGEQTFRTKMPEHAGHYGRSRKSQGVCCEG